MSPAAMPVELPQRPLPRRASVTLVAATAVFALVTITWRSTWLALAVRVYLTAGVCLLTFMLTERWPRRLPDPLARWAVQVISVALAAPLTLLSIYLVDTPASAPAFWHEPERAGSFAALSLLGMLVSSWTAMTALMRDRDARIVRAERARAEIERQADDARARLLQAQVAPHFLFNTLAAVQSLLDAGSPKAATLFSSLVSYLRAAVPRLDQRAHTLESEMEIVRAYLALMQIRIPDRLQFGLDVDARLLNTRCPPLTLMTLVENAVRHGIDPSIDGGRIDVRIRPGAKGRIVVQVRDTGVGITGDDAGTGTGTGLAALRQRLQQFYPGEAHLRVTGNAPRGVLAEVELPGELP